MTHAENPYLSYSKPFKDHKRRSIQWPPVPSPKPYLAYGNYPSYYRKRGPSDDRIKLLKEKWFKGKNILDIGCNAGHVSIEIASQFEPLSVTGVDIDPVLVRKARNQLYKRSSLMKGSDMNYFPMLVLDHFGTLPLTRGDNIKFPSNVQFRAGNWLEEPIQEVDVILALSITKVFFIFYGSGSI
jgi:7SK snRNA methylphosphate capping enzyme